MVDCGHPVNLPLEGAKEELGGLCLGESGALLCSCEGQRLGKGVGGKAYPHEGTFALRQLGLGWLLLPPPETYLQGHGLLSLRSESLPLLPSALGLIIWNLRTKEGAAAGPSDLCTTRVKLPTSFNV